MPLGDAEDLAEFDPPWLQPILHGNNYMKDAYLPFAPLPKRYNYYGYGAPRVSRSLEQRPRRYGSAVRRKNKSIRIIREVARTGKLFLTLQQ